jgi:hypothetical protein
MLRKVDEDERLFGDFRVGRYAWELADVKPLDEVIKVKGYQGLWNWDGDKNLPSGGGNGTEAQS